MMLSRLSPVLVFGEGVFGSLSDLLSSSGLC